MIAISDKSDKIRSTTLLKDKINNYYNFVVDFVRCDISCLPTSNLKYAQSLNVLSQCLMDSIYGHSIS